MLGRIHTYLLVKVTLLFLTQTGTECRAENDFSLVTLPEWRTNSEYVTQCFYDRHNNLTCDWTRKQLITEDVAVNILESGPLGLEGEACLEFWYLSPVAANGSELHVLLKNGDGLVEIWTSTALPRDSWRQVVVPLNIIKSRTRVVLEAVQAASMEEHVTFNQIGVRRWSCGHQCESNTEFWTDESTRCLCSVGQLSCSPSQCPKGQICGPQIGSSNEISASGTCTIHSQTDCSTFDGVLFRFMTPCTYILAKTCSPSDALPMFSVEVVNEQNENSSLTTVKRVIVDMGNYRVSLLKRQTHRVVVNGVWRKLPLSLDSGTVDIKSNPAAVVLGTSFGLFVSYDSTGAIHVKLPSTYSDNVCGLCGNFNHIREDDLRKPDGTNAQDATGLAESWQTGQTTSSCETILVPHQCDPLEEAEYSNELYCGGLLSSMGPFADCLSVVGAESYFRGCVVSMCSTHGDPAVLCEKLQVYSEICQEAGVAIPIWRNSTFCPLQCGENSHYNSCADGCPEVCSNLDIAGSCGNCKERCECDSGFKLSGGKCVQVEDCGCWYNGKHYEKGETLLEGECVKQCQCMGNNDLQCTTMQCADNEVCKDKDGVKGCFPFNPVTCSVYGDPHYITFDKMAYDFQGGCSYTLTTTCGGESLVQFTVIGHNMHPPLQNTPRSKLEVVALQVEDLYLTLNQSGEVYVNDVRVQLPYSTNDTYGSVWVYMKNNYIILETTFGLKMLIDGQNRLFLQVDERYKYELCGLCGTYSEQQDDDFITPEGKNATGPFEFGDSWRVPVNNECIAYPNDPKLCDDNEENEAYNECYTLLAEPFRPCHESIHPSIYLNSCVYDYCATSGDQHTLCESLKSYAAACQVAEVELPHWETDTACAEPPTTATLPTTPTSPTPDQTFCPINCDFETYLWGWEQLIQDSFDWTRNSGPTPSDLTGPNKDHTTGAGFYMYIEGNSVTHGDSARLLSSMCHYNGPLCLHFWYHMYGSATAMALKIYLVKDNKATNLWSMMNNQGPEWRPGNVDIKASGPFQIIVEGIRGSNAQSDVAIDDISIHYGSCSGSFPGLVSGTELPSTTAEVLPSHPVCNISCSFNSNLCSWNQMITDAFDWTWQSGSTPTLMTGPSADYTGDGHYLYIEASGVTHGDTARLISSECSDSGSQCLQFWYHMYGSADTMGLNVYLLQNKEANIIWWKRNDQGNMWQMAQVDFTTTGNFQIIIEGRRGSNEESDVAIDDVKLFQGQCSDLSGVATSTPKPDGNTTAPPSVSLLTTAASVVPVANVTIPPVVEATTNLINKDNVTEAPDNRPPSHPVCQLHCNFEHDLCQWSQHLADVFDWTRHSGSTPTMMTGPSSDHTTGDGHYLYIEANTVSYGDTARLISSECSDSGPQCLQFWYHMYGSADTMGLNVYLLQNNVADAVWWKRNDQGNMWQLAQMDLTTTVDFQIIFEGRRGSNDLSDVAIDDVSLHHGHCADQPKPISPAPTTSNPVATEDPELPQANSSTATQPQTSTLSNTQPPSTTAVTAEWDTQTPTIPATTVTPETSKPDVTTSPQLEITSRPITTATTGPKTTARTEQPATSTTGPQTTAGPLLPTTAQPQLATTGRPKPPTETQPQPTVKPQSPTTVEPKPPTETQPQTTIRPHPITTIKPYLTTGRPHPTITAQAQSATTVTPQPPTETKPEPLTTAEPKPPTENQSQPTIIPQPLTTVKPKPPTETQPQPTVKPQPLTTAGQKPSTETQSQPTVKPQPPTTAGQKPPTETQPQPHTTDPPQPPTTIRPHPIITIKPHLTTGRANPTTRAQAQPPTTVRPQPPTETQPQPQTTVKPQPPTTAEPKPATDTQSQPTVKPQPLTKAEPKPPTETQQQPQTTATPQPPTTIRPHPITTIKPYPTTGRPYPTTRPITTATAGPKTTARTEQPATSTNGSKTTDIPQLPTTAQPQPPTTFRPQPPTDTQPQLQTSATPQPPTTIRPHPTITIKPHLTKGRAHPTTTAQPQPRTTAEPKPPTETQPQPTVEPQPITTIRPHPTTSIKPYPTTGRPYPTTRPITTATAGPKTTARTEQPATSTNGSKTTDIPQLPTTAQPQPPTTFRPQPPTDTQPQLQTSATPQPLTTIRPHPTITIKPHLTKGRAHPTTTAQPQPRTTAEPKPPTETQPQPTVEPQPITTIRPHPTTSIKPHPTTGRPYPTTTRPITTATTGPKTTARTEQPSTSTNGPQTTARPQLPTTAQPQPPTTIRPQPPTEAQPQPQTTIKPQPLTTAKPKPSTEPQPQPTVIPQPPTTAGPKPPTETQPQTTATPQRQTTIIPHLSTIIKPHPTTCRPYPTTTTTPQSTTTARPQSTTTAVPTPSCPKNSHYTTCIPACSHTCTQLNAPPHCSDNMGCVKGCVCDEGFVQKWMVCVPIQQCGCVDGNGTKHQFNEVWFTNHCSQKCKCMKDKGVGKIDCNEKDECAGNAVCLQNEKGEYYCQSTGFNECTIKGDPEYKTFDKMKHDFDGEHSYVLVRTNNLPNNLPDVYIVGINTHTAHDDDDSQHHSRRVRDEDEEEDDDDDDDDEADNDEDDGDEKHDDKSVEHKKHHRLQELKITVYNHTVEFKKNRTLVVDGRRTNTPVSPTAGLNIRKHSSRIYLNTDFGLSVEFDGHSTAEIILPCIYIRKVGGLCGNFDGQKWNDQMKPDGTRATSVQEFGESWRV